MPKIVQQSPMNVHELVFTEEIPIKKYLIGFECIKCPTNDVNEIKKALKDYGYDDDIKILTENYPFPSFDELINKK